MQTPQSVLVFSIIAAVISFIGLIITIVNCVILVKNYKKSKRIEFIQRRDHLFQAISNLNDRNTEFHSISARYVIVAAKNAGLPLRGEEAERNTALIASINKQQEGVEEGIKLGDEIIKKLHSIYSVLTLEKDAPNIEEAISIAQVASDNLKKAVNGYLSVLHILETSNELIKTNLAETEERLRQIDLDYERAIRELKKLPG